MKKKTLLSLLFATAAIFVTTLGLASGNHKMMGLIKPRTMMGYGAGPTILRIITTTPGGDEIVADEMKIFEGQNCGSLAQVFDFHSTNQDDYIVIDNEQVNLSSSDLVELIGPRQGCFKIDLITKRKTASTGPVRLVWNGTSYASAYPSDITMNF